MKLPSRIDRYQIRERLGQGGMGMLFLALDPAIDRLVALKVLRVDNPDVRERFEREARLAARLQHPNIVTVYDVGEHEGQPFIAMEYIPGETLGELIRRRAPLDLRQKLEMMIEVCGGLAFAHKHGIIHRDIKPANLIVSRDSAILKILDFGIARAGESGLTQVGMVIGTPNYMSPEQIRGDVLDHRSDIFAVGLVLYELLAYRQAFTADTQPAVLMKILSEEPTPITKTDPTIDPALVKVLTRALAKSPEQRYQDLAAMKTDLVRIVQRLETEPEDGRTMIVPPPSGRTGPISPPRPPGGQGPGQPPVQPTGQRPGQPPADTGRTAKVARYLTGAEQALAAGDADAARAQLELAAAVDPANPRLNDVRARLQAAIDTRERDQQSRAAAALTHARHAFQAGALDTASRALNEALGLAPDDAEALALRDQINAALASRASAPPARPPTGPQRPPTEASTRPRGPAAGSQAGPSSGVRAAAPTPPPPPPPPPMPASLALASDGLLDEHDTPGMRLPPARVLMVAGLGVVAVILFVVIVWRWFSGDPSTAPTTPAVVQTAPGTANQPAGAPATPPPGGTTPTPGTAQPGAPPAQPVDTPTTPGPTTPPAGDAALTTRLANAVSEFQAGRTAPALRTLADLFDEAPQRDDLRLTAEQWARTLQERAVGVRRSARLPPQGQPLPQPMRQADQHARAARAALESGDPLAAARGFEQARLAWTAIVSRQVLQRGINESGSATPGGTTPNAAPPATAPAPPQDAPTPAPEAPVSPPPAAERTEPAPSSGTTQEDFERASILRVLQSFERAFEARSAESLKPIWPTLSAGEQQNYRSQFGRVLHQQWTFNSVRIGIDPDGKRAAAICQISITSLAPGARDTKSEARPVTFKFEKVGAVWTITTIAGL